MGAVDAIAGTAMGLLTMATQKRREKRAVENQRSLMGTQLQNQMALNRQGQQLQLDTWQKTSYPAQLAMMKEAGLSPGLMYGGGGSGGVTGGQGGGSASGGQAPAPQQMDIGSALATAKMAAELDILKSQKENIDADTGLKKGQTEVASTTIEKLKTEITNTEANTKLTEIESSLKSIEQLNKQRFIDAEVNHIVSQIKNLDAQKDLTDAERNLIIKQTPLLIEELEKKIVLQGVMIELERENIKYTKARTKETETHKQAILTSLVQTWTHLGQREREVKVAELLSAFNTNVPSHIGQFTGIIGNILAGARNATSVLPGGGAVVKGFGR